jgi:hypothetical protein
MSALDRRPWKKAMNYRIDPRKRSMETSDIILLSVREEQFLLICLSAFERNGIFFLFVSSRFHISVFNCS